MWLDDVFWLRAGKFVADHASAYGPIFAPAELQSLAQNVLPLPFTHLYAPGRGIAVLPKGDADQLALSWLKEARKLRVLYADEVFIAVTGDQGPPVVDTAGNHVPTFYDYVDRTLFGKIVRSTWIDPKLTQRAGKPYALIAATSRNGNAGDTLVTAACVELIRQARPDWDCVVTNGDVDPPMQPRLSSALAACCSISAIRGRESIYRTSRTSLSSVFLLKNIDVRYS